jgi:hypothetical protein
MERPALVARSDDPYPCDTCFKEEGRERDAVRVACFEHDGAVFRDTYYLCKEHQDQPPTDAATPMLWWQPIQYRDPTAGELKWDAIREFVFDATGDKWTSIASVARSLLDAKLVDNDDEAWSALRRLEREGDAMLTKTEIYTDM